MHSVQAEMWDRCPSSKHASPLPPRHPSNFRLVTTATPAKRITFYKSGDSQFGGVRMAIHKRSFKCFDALLDDLSQKVPLPFGVRTVTTPRGIHVIKHLEQLQDGGCYLCSDRRQAKPVNMELASRRPGIWYHHSRRPHRPESSSATPPSHASYRQRRILLVKNSEPGMRRSVVLSRRSARSLRAFLDEVSEVMQFHVRKLYTAEGRRIDSVQSLMTCPGVLVCVGREAFSPMLVNFIRKSSEEKLPGLGSRTPGNGGPRSPATQGVRSPPRGAQSRASEYSEEHESKKNVNFGLETKKSIIHPRSDSSNRSTRFSLSSEKSYGNGVSSYSQARPAIMNDDIEKRVLVNKDGSLSVEMRVRFRLHNDETLQWSTQVKKSPSLTNDCCPLSQAHPHYLQQGQSESCSDPDSTSFDPEGVDYSNQPLQRVVLEDNRCPCCYQRPAQQYDLWENPAHSHKKTPAPPPHASNHTIMRHTHSSSSTSSCNSRRVVRCRARVTNCGGGAEQSQLLQEEMFVTEQRRVEVERDEDTHVEVCRVSRCCSRSEVVTSDNNLRPLSGKSVEDESMMEDDGEVSAISNSSHVLQSLKEDQDDELPPSVSQCSHGNELSPSPAHLNDEVPSNVCAEEDEVEGTSRAVSAACSCPHSRAEAEEVDRAPSSKSRASRASCRSCKAEIPDSEEGGAADDEDEEIKRAVSGLSGHTGLSMQSKASSVCPHCGGCKSGANSESGSRASLRSHHSHQASPKPPPPLSTNDNPNTGSDDDGSEGSAVSTQSNKTNLTNEGHCSVISNVLEGRAPSAMSRTSATSHTSKRSHKSSCSAAEKEEERCPSAVSAMSSKSHKSNCSRAEKEEERCPSAVSAMSSNSHKSNCSRAAEEENAEERPRSSLSAKSGASAKTSASVQIRTKAASPTESTDMEEDDTKSRSPSVKSGKAERPDSVVSAESSSSHHAKAETRKEMDEPEAAGDGEGVNAEERAVSAMSAKSNISAKSDKSHKSSKAPERSLSPRTGVGEEEEARTASQASVKSNVSVKTSKSCKLNNNDNRMVDDEQLSVKSNKSACSAKSCCKNCDASSRVASPAATKREDRTPSAMSGKSKASAKSSTSQNRNKASPNPDDVPAIEMNGEEEPNECFSVKSECSASSCTSHKSGKSLKPASPSPNVTIQTLEGVEEEGAERAQSAASAKSRRSNVSAVSHKSSHAGTADVALTEAANENIVEDDAPKSKSHSQMLSPKAPRSRSAKAGGESRGPSALSVHSTASVRSGKSKCSCGSAKKEKDVEQDQEMENEEASSVKQRRDSGSTKQALSRASSGSVSLGLPEDQDTADSDSGKSSVSFHTNTERKGRVKTVPPHVPKSPHQKEEREGTSPQSRPAVEIPTIETPGGSQDKVGEQRVASVISTKSGRSHKSTCNCSVKLDKPKELHTSFTSTKAGNDIESAVSHIDAPHSRTSSAASTAHAKVCQSKSPTSVKNTSAAGDEEDAENQESRPASEAEGKEDIENKKAASVSSKSPCCLRPESAASAHSGSKVKASKKNKGEDSVKDVSVKSSGSVKTFQKQDIKPSSPCPSHGSKCKAETCSESTLTHSLSAADLLKETMVAASRPNSQQSKVSRTSDKSRSKRCHKSRDQGDLELTPACLPNASPNEVVSDWLRSIPADSSMLELGDELNEEEKEKVLEELPEEEVEKDVEEKLEEEEKVEAEKEEEVEGDAAEEEQGSGPAPAPPRPHTLLSSGDSLPRNLSSSAAVMKVLLSSSLGRCQSMPEVSPVYGRRLSTSAKGLLDCLAQLQLIEPSSPGFELQKNQRYEDIMVILQSLWLTEPQGFEGKDVEQVSPPRSSSGVGMSSGSAGSGKENGNQGGDETTQNEAKATPSLDNGGAEKVAAEEEEGNAEEEHEDTDVAEDPTQSEDTVPPSLDSPKATETSSDKSSANDSSKSPTDNEHETPEDSSSATPPTVLRAPLSKRLSQDPDPVWVLHLLKKLEKQFMNHYITAMAEFKVRWDLDDSLILDTMIGELKDEVSRRIQSSIEREVRKIQSRAGKGGRSPRPPQRPNLSRESTMTEKRRRILKVMKNQSVKTAESLSDGEMTAEFSDQRSDDEYCPCDACVRKKMAARPLKTNPLAAEAPVMMEFDLLKILQLKKSPSPVAEPQPAEEEGVSEVTNEEGRSLEVVQEEEEEEETKEHIKAHLVLEETIPEENEEMEREEEGEVEAEEGSDAGEGEEEGGKEEMSENKEEEAECQCKCAGNDEEAEETVGEEDAEEASDNTGEGETGDDGTGEEGSDRVKGETAEGGEEEEEDCKVSEFKEEEEASGDESAAKNEEEEEDGGVEGESDEGKKGEEASEEEESSSKDHDVTANQGEEADAEDTDHKGEEDVVEKFKPEEEDDKKEDGTLLHQITRTSVETQPGSLEDASPNPPPVNVIEVPKMAAADAATGGGTGQRRSCSPGKVKCRKPKETDMGMNDF